MSVCECAASAHATSLSASCRLLLALFCKLANSHSAPVAAFMKPSCDLAARRAQFNEAPHSSESNRPDKWHRARGRASRAASVTRKRFSGRAAVSQSANLQLTGHQIRPREEAHLALRSRGPKFHLLSASTTMWIRERLAGFVRQTWRSSGPGIARSQPNLTRLAAAASSSSHPTTCRLSLASRPSC